MHLSSGGGSSDLSLKDGSESSSPLSSDSEYEAFYSINKFSSPSVDEVPCIKEKLQVSEEENVGCMLKAEGYKNYEELLGRITKYEEEHRVLKRKLEFSEEEVATLKCELKKKETLTGNLQARLESALGGIEMKNADIDSEKRRALQMQNQINELVTQVSESNDKIRVLEVELEFYLGANKESEEEIIKLKELTREVSEGSHQLQGQLELAWKDIAKLEAELDSERRHVAEQQERTGIYIADLSIRDHEIKELKAQLQAEISSFSEQKILLGERLEECEAKIMNMKRLHEAREIGLQGEIHQLKEEHAERGDIVEVLNKNLDMLKLKYDMVMAEKDELNAKVQTLMAEMSSQNSLIRHTEEHSNRLQIEHMELTARSDTAHKLVDELRSRVEELKTELGRQRALISEGAEEKREAIRQLCFSLEHYRSGYHELRQAFIGHRRLAVMAS